MNVILMTYDIILVSKLEKTGYIKVYFQKGLSLSFSMTIRDGFDIGITSIIGKHMVAFTISRCSTGDSCNNILVF